MIAIISLLFYQMLWAELTTSPIPSPRPDNIQLEQNSPPLLPRCVDNENDIQRIREHMNNNRRNQYKYDQYKEILSSDSDVQLWARLAYAEVLATNCPQQNQAVGEMIVNVIGNRVQLRGGNIQQVVFQRDQFASSLNIYANSRYRDFLCPKDSELWQQILRQIQDFQRDGRGRLASNTVNYFLYQHDPRWTSDPWNYREDTSHTTPELRRCIRSFHVPGWPYN
jgi:hypothetical protein